MGGGWKEEKEEKEEEDLDSWSWLSFGFSGTRRNSLFPLYSFFTSKKTVIMVRYIKWMRNTFVAENSSSSLLSRLFILPSKIYLHQHLLFSLLCPRLYLLGHRMERVWAPTSFIRTALRRWSNFSLFDVSVQRSPFVGRSWHREPFQMRVKIIRDRNWIIEEEEECMSARSLGKVSPGWICIPTWLMRYLCLCPSFF